MFGDWKLSYIKREMKYDGSPNFRFPWCLGTFFLLGCVNPVADDYGYYFLEPSSVCKVRQPRKFSVVSEGYYVPLSCNYYITVFFLSAGCDRTSCKHGHGCSELCPESIREGKKIPSM